MVDAETARLTARIIREGEEDRVAIEEPLEIRVDGAPLAVTMRTPGHDEELALGFLYGEGLIDGPRRVGLTADLAANVVEVEGPLLRDPGERRFYTTSSCGVCGKGALEEVAVQCPVVAPGPVVPRALLAALPDGLRQPGFELTGGRAGPRRPAGAARRVARGGAPAGLGAAGRPARARLVRRGGRVAARAGGRGPPQRDGQGRGAGASRRAPAALRPAAVRQRAPVVRARAEGGRRRGARARRGRRAVVAGRRARRRPRAHAVRLRPPRPRQRLHRARARRPVGSRAG